MVLVNTTGVIGSILLAGTQSITGDMFANLILILIFLIAICMLFGIPMEFVSIIIIPFLIATATEYTLFIPVLGVTLIYISILITKNWIFR